VGTINIKGRRGPATIGKPPNKQAGENSYKTFVPSRKTWEVRLRQAPKQGPPQKGNEQSSTANDSRARRGGEKTADGPQARDHFMKPKKRGPLERIQVTIDQPVLIGRASTYTRPNEQLKTDLWLGRHECGGTGQKGQKLELPRNIQKGNQKQKFQKPVQKQESSQGGSRKALEKS